MLQQQRAHKWEQFMVDWLPDRTLAIVGYGEIGRECALLAKSLGLRIAATRRRPELLAGDPVVDQAYPLDQLHQMLSDSDYVVAAAPLTPETRHMISDAEFKAMKSSAVVINVGRGPVIDEQALIRALKTNQIAAAALDVFEQEPLAENSHLWDMPNVLISPHCTDRTRDPDWLDLAMRRFVDNFRHFLAGEPLRICRGQEGGLLADEGDYALGHSRGSRAHCPSCASYARARISTVQRDSRCCLLFQVRQFPAGRRFQNARGG